MGDFIDVIITGIPDILESLWGFIEVVITAIPDVGAFPLIMVVAGVATLVIVHWVLDDKDKENG